VDELIFDQPIDKALSLHNKSLTVQWQIATAVLIVGIGSDKQATNSCKIIALRARRRFALAASSRYNSAQPSAIHPSGMMRFLGILCVTRIREEHDAELEVLRTSSFEVGAFYSQKQIVANRSARVFRVGVT
jgi:hypothetical protein